MAKDKPYGEFREKRGRVRERVKLTTDLTYVELQFMRSVVVGAHVSDQRGEARKLSEAEVFGLWVTISLKEQGCYEGG